MTRLLPVALLLLALAVAGCSRSLNMEKEVVLTGEKPSVIFTVDPIKSQQTVKVSATSDNPITVIVGLQKNKDALEAEAMAHKFTDKSLAKAQKERNVSLEATIPANDAAVVFVTREANGPTKVNVKITN